jgi:muramoyltetrapeptide carboxypeptidase
MTAPLRVPAPVLPGAHIRVISPALPTLARVPVRARRGEQALNDAGFTVSYGQNAWRISADGTTAGSPQQRAQDLMDAFADQSVDAVLSADAGTGTRDLLDFLEPGVLAANPKPFIGFCDNVYLNQYLASQAGLSSLYGCSLMYHLGEAGGAFPETLHYLTQALAASPLICTCMGTRTGEYLNWHLPHEEACSRQRSIPGGWTWLRGGSAAGPLFGGEITIIKELVSAFVLPLESAVLFWHVAYHGEPPDRSFRDLCKHADLTGLAGMIIGAHPIITPTEWAAQVSDMLDEMLPALTCPTVVNADIGHMSPSWTVPYGEQVVLDSAGPIKFPRVLTKMNS